MRTDCPVSKRYNEQKTLSPNLIIKKIVNEIVFECENAKNGCSWRGTTKIYNKYHKNNCVMDRYPQFSNSSIWDYFKTPGVAIVQKDFEDRKLTGILVEEGKLYPGLLEYKNGNRYEGLLFKDVKHGPGKLFDVSEKLNYEGLWENDEKNGFFTIYKGKDIVFEGFFNQNLMEGDCFLLKDFGSLRAVFKNGVVSENVDIKYNDGSSYIGSSNKSFEPEGKGCLINSKGNKYFATYENGEPVSDLKIEYVNGDVFCGTISRDYKKMDGKMEYSNKDVYEGQFLNDLRSGTGILTCSDGSIKEGQWELNLLEGPGKVTTTDKIIYECTFKKNLPNGSGTKTKPDGTKITGHISEWYYLSGQGSILLKNGILIEGIIANDQINGPGKITKPNGDVYIGLIENNKLKASSQKVEIQYADGRIYKGECQKELPVGKGSLFVPNEGTYTGLFVNGLLNGQVSICDMQKRKSIAAFSKGEKITKPNSAMKPEVKPQTRPPAIKSANRPAFDKKQMKDERIVTEPNRPVRVKQPKIKED